MSDNLAPSLIVLKTNEYLLTELSSDPGPNFTLSILSQFNTLPQVRELQGYSHEKLLKFEDANRRRIYKGNELRATRLFPHTVLNDEELDMYIEYLCRWVNYRYMYIFDIQEAIWKAYHLPSQEPI